MSVRGRSVNTSCRAAIEETTDPSVGEGTTATSVAGTFAFVDTGRGNVGSGTVSTDGFVGAADTAINDIELRSARFRSMVWLYMMLKN